MVGPLYGLQSKNGYDMPPNTKLTPTQLKRFMTPWKYAPKAMIWDGRYVTIQPIPRKAPAKAAAPATPGPMVKASVIPSAGPSPTPSVIATPTTAPTATGSPAPVTAILASEAPVIPTGDGPSPASHTGDREVEEVLPIVGLLAAAMVIAGLAIGVRARRGRQPG